MPKSEMSVAYYESPIGLISVRGSEAGLSGLDFVKDEGRGGAAARVPGRDPKRRAASSAAKSPTPAEAAATLQEALPSPLRAALVQLDEYFRGERISFTVKLDLGGTAFQRQVWSRLLKVRFGQTTTYKALAEAVGNPAATRAVGGANHSNPVSIIVPCHRVVGSDGRLTGYGGGLWRKEWLLRHEQARGLFV